MPSRPKFAPLRYAAATLLLLSATACGEAKKYDWKNRDIAWKWGPTTGGARYEHLVATGTKGDKPMADGWKMRLVDGNKITVKAVNLDKEHSLLGKTTLRIGLFDKQSGDLTTLSSAAVTADNASFSFEVSEDIAKKIWDAIIWFRKA